MSPGHTRLGPSGLNWRSSTFSATGRLWLESVVALNFLAVLALMSCSCINLATVLTQQSISRLELGVDARAAVTPLDLQVDGADLPEDGLAAGLLLALRAREP